VILDDTLSESALIEQAQAGQVEALARLLNPYRESIFRLAYRVCGRPDDAEDLAQDALVRIIHGLPKYRGGCEFRTWVYRVALHSCLSGRTRSRETAPLPESLETADPGPGPETLAIQSDLRRQVEKEIQRLPRAYRAAVLLRLTDELSYAEIAETLEIPVATALTRVHRGMKRLRARLQPWLDEGGQP